MLHTRIFEFNPIGTNCILAWADGSSTCAVFDPGMSSQDGLERLCGFLAERSLTPGAIFLTHGHFDHVWGVKPLLEKFPVPVYMSEADNEVLHYGASIFGGHVSFKSLDTEFEFIPVQDGQTLSGGGTGWTVIATPGHTPGSVCYYCRENNLLISGDTLFAGAIGRTDLFGGDYDALMKSLMEKVMVLPGETDVIPGHGQPTTVGREGTTNPFLQPFNEPDSPMLEDGIPIHFT